jgi:hypothetical protein
MLADARLNESDYSPNGGAVGNGLIQYSAKLDRIPLMWTDGYRSAAFLALPPSFPFVLEAVCLALLLD